MSFSTKTLSVWSSSLALLATASAPGYCADDTAALAPLKLAAVPRRSALSLEADVLLDQLGLRPLVENLHSARQEVARIPAGAVTLESLAARQELLEVTQRLSRAILRANLEVDYVLAAIEGEQNELRDTGEELGARRDRNVWRSTILSQWSNGVLWSASSAFTLASANNVNYSYPDGVLGILAGAIPTALALRAMRQSHGPQKPLPVEPNLLAAVLDKPGGEDSWLPGSVMAYLDRAPADGSSMLTRRQQLLNRWIKNGYLPSRTSAHFSERGSILAGTLARKGALTLDLIETRQKMLSDLRAEV
ncbi:MAG TPA: hypothetical protein V6D08_19935, partial [Candidatus Obscuribacterales bacterium]